MLYRKDGKSVVVHNLGAGTPTWLDWESGGDALALMQEGVGLYLWEVGKPQPGQEASGAWVTSLPLKLAPSITVATSFCMWSKLYPHLAIGTDKGKVCTHCMPGPPIP